MWLIALICIAPFAVSTWLEMRGERDPKSWDSERGEWR